MFLLWLVLAAAGLTPATAQDSPPSVFEIPQIKDTMAQLRFRMQAGLRGGRYDEVIQLAGMATKLVPFDLPSYYDLARAYAQKGNQSKAMESLRKVVSLGLSNNLLLKHPDFAELRGLPEFQQLVKSAGKQKPAAKGWKWDIAPTALQDGVALVSASNTGWDSQLGMFRSYFSPATDRDQPVIPDRGTFGNQLRGWNAAGTGAGNYGDYYDNHDVGHSILEPEKFPQLARIEFDEIVKKHQFHTGLQNRFLYNGVVLGNSSTAITNSPIWRSQARWAYTDGKSIAMLYAQYRHNHLYVYPEHKDHDPGRNGNGGYGDVFAANTPYLIVSQGSSGSDYQFLDVVAATLASFHPDVKDSLKKHGILMPTVQMILRRCYGGVDSPADYLTGRAHPTVFDKQQLYIHKMVRLAHEIKSGEEPPMVQLRVVEEDVPVPGRDYFHSSTEHLFDSPCAIARIARSTQYWRRMVVSAEQSFDINKKPLSYNWVVLRGNPSRVQIKPLNEDRSVVELRVAYHKRRPIRRFSKMDSNRVDIGAFVYNGTYPSAPGFVTFFWLDNELRVYDERQRIKSVTYADRERGNYVDPLIDRPKKWIDEYRYDEQDRLLGWTRIHGRTRDEFTADGALVLKRDGAGRPQTARTVRYVEAPQANHMPVLKQEIGNELLHYEYSGDDQLGKVVRREPVSN